MSTNLKLELATSKVTVRFLAENTELPDAQTLLRGLRETVVFLERRIAREKLALAREGATVVHSQSVRPS